MSFASPLFHDVLLSRSPRVSKEARGIVQVRTKIARSAKAVDTLAEIRPVIETLVRGEEYVTGSRMQAYDNVGAAIGKSPSWVRKLIGRHEVGLQHFEFLNIVRAYGALCLRIEAAAAANRLRADLATERLQAEQPRGTADALAERPDRLVAGAGGPGRR